MSDWPNKEAEASLMYFWPSRRHTTCSACNRRLRLRYEGRTKRAGRRPPTWTLFDRTLRSKRLVEAAIEEIVCRQSLCQGKWDGDVSLDA